MHEIMGKVREKARKREFGYLMEFLNLQLSFHQC